MTALDLRPVRPVRPAWWLLAVAESRLIVRNRTVLLSATLMPLVFGLMLTMTDIGFLAGAPGALAATQLVFLQSFGILMTVAMTLAARRQQLYLKRMRTSPASTAAIVAGLTAPLVAIVLLQTVPVYAATAAATDSLPAQPLLLLAAYAVGAATMIGLGFLTAAFTKSPEAAQFTVLPAFMAVMIGMTWSQTAEAGAVGVRHLLAPGAAPALLARAGWDGPVDWVSEVVLPLGVGAVVAAVVCVLAARLFHWQPRA